MITDWLAEHRDDPDAEGATLVYAGPLILLDGLFVEEALEIEPHRLQVTLRDGAETLTLEVRDSDVLWLPNCAR